jgi:ComF family protein
MAHFVETYHLDIHQFDLFMPVPLSATKSRERGYNQSHLLAHGLSMRYNIPLSKNNLIKIRETETQTHLSQKERWTNIAGAFRIKNSKEIKSKNILIIDDLLTTGATSSEAAKTLKQNSAQDVGVFTLAGAI